MTHSGRAVRAEASPEEASDTELRVMNLFSLAAVSVKLRPILEIKTTPTTMDYL